MIKEKLGYRVLEHSNGCTSIPIEVSVYSDKVKLTCNMPNRWFMQLTKKQAIKLIAIIFVQYALNNKRKVKENDKRN